MSDHIDMTLQPGNALRIWEATVPEEWLDYNGHVTEHRYLQAFGESSDALYALIGIDFANARDGAYFTLETHIRHLAECKIGARLYSETEILAYDEKRIHLFHRLFDGGGILLSTGEHLAIHVAHAKVRPASATILSCIAAILMLKGRCPSPTPLAQS